MRTAVRPRLELAAPVLAAGLCCADAQTPERIAPDADWANAITAAVVRPHEAKDMYFIATRPGSYELTCADHDWAGMTARITVE